MSTFILKIIAITAMLIDHVGYMFFPQHVIFEIIGRIAFPIFAYLLVEGFVHTRNVKKYMLRLGVFALVSEIPFDLMFFGKLDFNHQNVFFTLFLGLLMLYLMDKMPRGIDCFLCGLVFVLAADLLRTDYGSFGILMIFWFYLYREQKLWKFIGIALINVLLMSGSQVYAILAFIPILLHNRKEGPKIKWFFYGFYPAHLLILYFVNLIL